MTKTRQRTAPYLIPHQIWGTPEVSSDMSGVMLRVHAATTSFKLNENRRYSCKEAVARFRTRTREQGRMSGMKLAPRMSWLCRRTGVMVVKKVHNSDKVRQPALKCQLWCRKQLEMLRDLIVFENSRVKSDTQQQASEFYAFLKASWTLVG